MARIFCLLAVCFCFCLHSGKAQFGFYPNEREERRYQNNFEFGQNFISYPKRVTDRLTGILHLRPNGNPEFIYPFNRPVSNNQAYDQYGRPLPPYAPNQYPDYSYDPYFGRPVQFPTSRPQQDVNKNQEEHFGDYFYNQNSPPENQNSPSEYPNSNPQDNASMEFSTSNDAKDQPKDDNDKTTPPPQINFPEDQNSFTQAPSDMNKGELTPVPNEGTNNQNGFTQSRPESNKDELTPVLSNGNGFTQSTDINKGEQTSMLSEGTSNQNGFTQSPRELTPVPSYGNGFTQSPFSFSNSELNLVPNDGTENQNGFTQSPGINKDELTPIQSDNTEHHNGFTNSPFNQEGATELPALTPVPESSGQELTPVLVEKTSGLPELTPLPFTESRNNFGFTPFQESCTTVDGGLGSCLSILSCEPYVRLLTAARSGNDPSVVDVLRKAHCGFDGSNPKVCCPRPGFSTPQPPALTPEPTQAPDPVPDPTAAEPKTNEHVTSTFLQPPVCGFSNASLGRVVNGVPARLGDFPWMALLGYKQRSGTGWKCGGSLISAKHVLTAAHCIKGHETALYVVRLGELDTARDDDGATPIDVLITKKIQHEQYDSAAYINDIGLLLLQHAVTFTDLIRPICIPQAPELRSNNFENYNPMIAGWGSIEFRGQSATHLQVVQLPVVSNDFCRSAYAAYKAQKIDERVLCAGYKRGGKDACQGDSGGPLMQPIWNSETNQAFFFQIGVVSFGKKCAEPGFPGVYSRVTHFVPWLHKAMLANP